MLLNINYYCQCFFYKDATLIYSNIVHIERSVCPIIYLSWLSRLQTKYEVILSSGIGKLYIVNIDILKVLTKRKMMLDSSKKHLTLHNSLAVKLLITKYEVHLLINFGDVCDKNIWTNELSDQQDPRV